MVTTRSDVRFARPNIQIYDAQVVDLASPRAETPDDWITIGFDEDLDDAAKAALRDMIRLIRQRSGLSAQDAYTLCSIAAGLRVTQMVDGNEGVHCVLAKLRMPGT
jgi:acetamidase/formamidase